MYILDTDLASVYKANFCFLFSWLAMVISLNHLFDCEYKHGCRWRKKEIEKLNYTLKVAHDCSPRTLEAEIERSQAQGFSEIYS